MTLPNDVERLVLDRARQRCEYCRMHQSLQGASFHVEHILPRVLGGNSAHSNLALARAGCNLHKSSRTTAEDPATGQVVNLFHPRNDDWHAHFSWSGYQLDGRTPTGRAAAAALHLNQARRLRVRMAEKVFGLWPPDGPDEQLIPST